MDKKKIAFVLDGAIVGGVETALMQMLQKIDTNRYEIHLFTNVKGNPCIGQIPECIKVVDLDDFDLRSNFFGALRKGKFRRAAQLLWCYFKLKRSKSEFERVKYSQEAFTLSEEVFDCAVAYRASWESVLWTMDHVKARKKVAWVHGTIWGARDQKWIERADKLFCVSEDAKRYIEHICPDVVGRAEVFYNLLDGEKIIEKATEEVALEDGIILATVGRLSSEKGQDMIPQTVRYLLDAGHRVKWYVVGDGALREKIERLSKELMVEDYVILTGTQSNPYPYMKNCDIYVQTSLAEGWGLTVQEAKVLHKPIVTTDLPVMREQIVHMKNGYITEGISPEALFEGIKMLLDNPALCERFTEELKKETHDNSRELEKLYAFVES